MRSGVSINPGTPVCQLEQAVHYADLVLVMSVNPGFGGQEFIPESLNKIRDLKEMRMQKNLDFLIQVDGGINEKNASELYQYGADVLVAGNYVFTAEDPLAAIEAIL
jgi:ribulose-phosphate 3-epimerase